MRLFAVAVELIVTRIVAHGVIESDLFTHSNVAHGDQAGGTTQPGVGIATMVEAIRRVAEKRIKQKEFFFNLKDSFGKVGDGRVYFVFRDDSPAPKDEDFMSGNRLAGDDSATAFFVKRRSR